MTQFPSTPSARTTMEDVTGPQTQTKRPLDDKLLVTNDVPVDDTKHSTLLAVEQGMLTATVGKHHMIKPTDIKVESEAQAKHLNAFTQGCNDWLKYQHQQLDPEDLANSTKFLETLLEDGPLRDEDDYLARSRDTRRKLGIAPNKATLVRVYTHLKQQESPFLQSSGPVLDRVLKKKNVRSNSGVVVITVVTAPGSFSCPWDCHYCPNEPGQPRSYLSTEPAVARANQNDFCPVRQFYDRASTLAKQGHVVDKIEIIVLGGTWSGYPQQYQEDFCRDLFFAANTFADAEDDLRRGEQLQNLIDRRPRYTITEEQELNEKAKCKIIGLTLETRPDYITRDEIRRLRMLGCTRVQIGVQHTDDTILKKINRGHKVSHAKQAVWWLKNAGFKVDIHLMPDLPNATPEIDQKMFDYVLQSSDLQADHWKVYPCEVTPFTEIEKWYEKGEYKPYYDEDPNLLINLLCYVKARVHPWIRLNRVIRDIPECSIIAGNSNTNLRQVLFERLESRGEACKCIRCREVRNWPEAPEKLSLKVRRYRSSQGWEFFITVEGGNRGTGGGATERGLKEKKEKKKKTKKVRSDPRQNNHTPSLSSAWQGLCQMSENVQKTARQALMERTRKVQKACTENYNYYFNRPVMTYVPEDVDSENGTLYGLLRLRLNDSPQVAGKCFPELKSTALIRELHVYGVVKAVYRKPNVEEEKEKENVLREVAAEVLREGDDPLVGDNEEEKAAEERLLPPKKTTEIQRPQHGGIGKLLMHVAEQIAIDHKWPQIAVISGIGVRNYYRSLGYEKKGEGSYLLKDLVKDKSSSEFSEPRICTKWDDVSQYEVKFGDWVLDGPDAIRKKKAETKQVSIIKKVLLTTTGVVALSFGLKMLSKNK